MKFAGVFTALVTPFKNGEVDEDSLLKVVRHQLDSGVQGFVISGTTGESPCLTQKEKKHIFSLVEGEVARQVPLIVGTGTNNTAEACHMTKDAAAWGADGVLVVVPYYNKPPQRGLVKHFSEVAKSTELPVLLYNVPARTITGLELDSIHALSGISNIVGIKEATGDVGFGKKIVERCGPNFLVTGGDDGTFLKLIEAGGQGVISVASHILPKEFVEWTKRARNKDFSVFQEEARFKNLISFMGIESNPIPVKAALYLMGLIDSPEMRLPLVSLAEAHMGEMRRLLQAAGILS